MHVGHSLVLLLLRLDLVFSVWTEADESRRIAQLKQEESRAFEMQMRGQNPFVGGLNDGYYGSQNYLYDKNGGLSSAYQAGHYGAYPERPIHAHGSTVHRVPIESRLSHASELRAPKQPQVANMIEVSTKSWCFHCASPWNLINSNMQQAMRNLLDIRRARFPATSYVRADCSHPKNVSDLPKQVCSIGYCQTLVLTDHDSATAMTIRGCAEKFGAVDERELKKRVDNSCKKLHQTVDIQECICENRKFCYSGSTRDFGYTEDSKATFHKCAQISFTQTNSAFMAILLTCLRFLSLLY